MSTRQLSISRSKAMQDVIDEARRTFPDADTDSQALTRALFHWLHNRESNSKRGAIDRVGEQIKALDNKLSGKLDVLLERGNYDTDHG